MNFTAEIVAHVVWVVIIRLQVTIPVEQMEKESVELDGETLRITAKHVSFMGIKDSNKNNNIRS